MKKSQIRWVKNQLKEKGKVSRNVALSVYISRLGAIIFRLKESGYVLEGKYVKTKNGRDFVYTLIEEPKEKII